MDIYRSYWRDDPEFDTAHTSMAAPHLPCPDIDRDTLVKLCRYAVESNFGWPRPRPVPVDFDLQKHLSYLPATEQRSAPPAQTEVSLGLQVNGPGGGQWQLLVDNGRVVAAEQGLASGSRATTTCYLNSQTFQRMAAGEGTAQQLIQAGRVLIEGDVLGVHEVERALQDVAAGAAGVALPSRCSPS